MPNKKISKKHVKKFHENKSDNKPEPKKVINKNRLTKFGSNIEEKEKQVSSFEKLTKVVVYLMLIATIGAIIFTAVASIMQSM